MADGKVPLSPYVTVEVLAALAPDPGPYLLTRGGDGAVVVRRLRQLGATSDGDPVWVVD